MMIQTEKCAWSCRFPSEPQPLSCIWRKRLFESTGWDLTWLVSNFFPPFFSRPVSHILWSGTHLTLFYYFILLKCCWTVNGNLQERPGKPLLHSRAVRLANCCFWIRGSVPALTRHVVDEHGGKWTLSLQTASQLSGPLFQPCKLFMFTPEICVCSCICCSLSTRIHVLLPSWRRFWQARTF